MSAPHKPPIDDYSRDARCSACRLGPTLCVCDRLPSISLPYRFIVLRHRNEISAHSNTGGLVGSLLSDSLILDHGLPEGPFDRTPLHDAAVNYQLLYPGPRAAPVSPDLAADGRPLTFVVLDASWRKARRMSCRIPDLHGMPMVGLDGPAQGVSLRKPPAPERFFTLEAVIRVVERMGDVEAAVQLREALDLVIRRRLHERGRLRKRQLFAIERSISGTDSIGGTQ